MFKFIYVCDLHGDIFLYEELKKLLKNNNFNALIIGGDLLKYTKHVETQLNFINDYFSEFVQNIDAEILLVPGNIDWPKSIELLKETTKVKLLDLKGDFINPYINIAGYENVIVTPFKMKNFDRRDLKDDVTFLDFKSYISNLNGQIELIESDYLNNLNSIEDDLDTISEQSNIWVTHTPPYGGSLDLTYSYTHTGSKALYKKIQENQPLLTLHGHIHESPEISGKWAESIGRTICVNPGKGEKNLHAVIGSINSYGEIISLYHTIYGYYRI